jgi:hypothetical protein
MSRKWLDIDLERACLQGARRRLRHTPRCHRSATSPSHPATTTISTFHSASHPVPLPATPALLLATLALPASYPSVLRLMALLRAATTRNRQVPTTLPRSTTACTLGVSTAQAPAARCASLTSLPMGLSSQSDRVLYL